MDNKLNLLPMIDWLSVTVDLEDYDYNMARFLTKLENCKQDALSRKSQGLDDAVLLELPEGISFKIMPTGHANFAYILHNDMMELRFAKVRSASTNNLPVFVHFKSEFLWAYEPQQCWNWFIEWMTAWFAPVIANKLNRVDLCCHTDLDIKLEPEYFKGRYVDDKINRSNRVKTGITFGSRNNKNIIARIYNKSVEIQRSKKLWFIDIWNKAGLTPDCVYNIELELKRKFLKHMYVNGNKPVETCEDLFANLKTLWIYCTTEWLVMIEYPSPARSDRAKTAPEWEQIQHAYDDYPGGSFISRKIQKIYKKKHLVAGAIGYLSTIAACDGTTDLEETLLGFTEECKNLLKVKGTTFETKVTDKIKLMGHDVKEGDSYK